jgi:two-component system phosphate regulon response regulator PhoB
MSATTAVDAQDGRTIVFVEDDGDLRSLYGDILRAAGFEVLECATLSEAFATLERVTPEILLLDYELPDGSGLDLARFLRLSPTHAGVRIVGFSGRSSARDIESALAAGCDTYVEKPCAPGALLAKMAEAIP